MDNLVDSENNAKISDSAYSNSCSNSQSRRSHSSKSTHSGSHSSGSSGYGGKPSTSGSSNNLVQPAKKEKEPKKKKIPPVEITVPDVVVDTEARTPEATPVFDAPKVEPLDVFPTSPAAHALSEKGVENMDISTSERNSVTEEPITCNNPLPDTVTNIIYNRSKNVAIHGDGFSCVISMHDGVVMYTTPSLTTSLGFPKDMWLGRSFIDFVHPRDRSTFASQITSGLAVPKIVNGTQEKVQSPANSTSTMVCRIRRYRSLLTSFGVKDKSVSYMPFLLKLTFKNIADEESKLIYLVIQATPFFSAFKTPHELVYKPVPFVIRHAADGIIEYVDPESVPYLGYLPQDLANKDALTLYHPEDLIYLQQVYEIIVKEGGLPRSKSYRMLTHNGGYLKVETEWSSFINPWSKKLEFVTGKHHIMEGPANPDVLQPQETEKPIKVSEEEKHKVRMLRENIIRIMNEVLTKPAEVARQQMTKRCQELASFMESLMEEAPKPDEELRLEIQEADNSYYERDSVMLGGISPHHDYNDSKSSTETPLSYNQLNYNETLQRYFESHQQHPVDDYHTITGENIFGFKDNKHMPNQTLSPMTQQSGVDSGDIASSCGSNMLAIDSFSPLGPLGDYHPVRLTESLLNKHNAEMEKELMKIHRESRSSTKGEREKATNETRLKKKEHLARCNASYHPTAAGATISQAQPHGVKRPSKHVDTENHKHHCPSARQARRKQRLSTSTAVAQPSSTITTTVAATNWPTTSMSNMNTFILGVGIPQQMGLVSPVSAMTGMFPMYYAPAVQPQGVTQSNNPQVPVNSTMPHFQTPAVPYMMYEQPMYGSPFMYSPMSHPAVSYPMQQTMMAQSMQCTDTMHPLGLTNRNYQEAFKPGLPLKPGSLGGFWRDKKRAQSQGTSSKTDLGSGDSSSSTKALNRESGASHSGGDKSTISASVTKSPSNSFCPKSTEAVPRTPPLRDSLAQPNKLNIHGNNNSEETVDKTDGESSYSSFYSSFFKTESGSAEESGDKSKKIRNPMLGSSSYLEPQRTKKVARRKMDPPWMEQVCVTSELIYKYQVLSKSMEEVLIADKQKMSTFEQPSLVNDQLGQLYLDLQLEGVAARLTLEESITSSSSSGEETSSKASKGPRRKREYSKLVMIYEEDAPLPSPKPDVEPASPKPTGECKDGAEQSTSATL